MHLGDIVILELIETLWNVNQEMMRIQLGMIDELIETLWNVNSLHRRIPSPGTMSN